jgi:DNA-binding Lrp family transcriptional regulator
LAAEPSHIGPDPTPLTMDIEARRDLRLLEAVAENSRVTQRRLATRLGIALGLTNIYLKRLTRKGYIKCVNAQPNRITYLITPRGVAEKMRLTYEFMDYSLHLYREVRHHLRDMLRDCARADRLIAIFGRGEAAELAYLSLKEFGLEPIAIFDQQGGDSFLGMRVRPIADHSQVPYDLIVVASFDPSGAPVDDLIRFGIDRAKLFPLRQQPGEARRRARAAVGTNA